MKILKIFLIIFLLLGANIQKASACACGCGVFNVGTSSIIPNCAGGTAFVQYDYINQGQNWHNSNSSGEGENHHKQVKTQVITAGAQYMFNRKWGLALRVPYMERKVVNENHTHAMDEHGHEEHMTSISSNSRRSVGDVRINAIYSGFFDDMSTGITFGLKLPTGNFKDSALGHRDMRIGTGSTDLLLGAYHMGQIDKEGKFNYFFQASLQHALVTRDDYRMGDEISTAVGIYYDAGSFLGIKKVAPIMQITNANRLRDSGKNAIAQNSGYRQIFFAPGIEFNFSSFKIYADVGFPLYQDVNGNQLVAERIYKAIFGYNF
jgi:hypothetical protein